ncbi:hypothetical protein DIJ64_05915 [Mycobacterium leprae]|uniref:Uncharacterized protein n=1 Tax=Mycobacterium leprae TaxID=1769 RepID=A0AAD0KUS1_MYCLR|nr:hypothetical protein [Mycobacterium leprae]AWV47776.1 hypothetical protein DIJ64_05915 [Mycobacterium leprae]
MDAATPMSYTAAETMVTLVSTCQRQNFPGLICAQVILSNSQDTPKWNWINTLHKMGTSTVGIHAGIAAYQP